MATIYRDYYTMHLFKIKSIDISNPDQLSNIQK